MQIKERSESATGPATRHGAGVAAAANTMTKIEDILREAAKEGASDIHLTVGVPPKMRVNGMLRAMSGERLIPSDTAGILASIIPDKLKPLFEDLGDYEFSFSNPEIGRFRVNAYRQRGSTGLTFRLVGSEMPDPARLSIPDQVMDMADKKQGLVVVAGAAGMGRSTTLAAIVDRINRTRNVHVMTLEEPIEFLHHHQKAIVNQREIGMDSRSCADALRAALREDPDVIMVEDMMDPDVIRLAITAAETGKLVLSSVPMPSVAEAVERIANAFPAQEQKPVRSQLARVLRLVSCQQLIPSKDGSFVRVAAFEIMNARAMPAKNVILEKNLSELASVMDAGPKSGMMPMDEALAALVADGRISDDDAVRFARNQGAMRNRIALLK